MPQLQAESADMRNRVEAARAAEVKAREAVRRQLQALTSEYQATQAATRSASQAVRCARMPHGWSRPWLEILRACVGQRPRARVWQCR